MSADPVVLSSGEKPFPSTGVPQSLDISADTDPSPSTHPDSKHVMSKEEATLRGSQTPSLDRDLCSLSILGLPLSL